MSQFCLGVNTDHLPPNIRAELVKLSINLNFSPQLPVRVGNPAPVKKKRSKKITEKPVEKRKMFSTDELKREINERLLRYCEPGVVPKIKLKNAASRACSCDCNWFPSLDDMVRTHLYRVKMNGNTEAAHMVKMCITREGNLPSREELRDMIECFNNGGGCLKLGEQLNEYRQNKNAALLPIPVSEVVEEHKELETEEVEGKIDSPWANDVEGEIVSGKELTDLLDCFKDTGKCLRLDQLDSYRKNRERELILKKCVDVLKILHGEEETKVSNLKGNEDYCAICQSIIKPGQKCYELECGHLFHRSPGECLGKSTLLDWIKVNPLCPVCREVIIVK